MIYMTAHDPATRQATGPSLPTNWNTLEQAENVMGEPRKRYAAMLIYDDFVFSRCVIHIDAPDNTGQTGTQTEPNSENDQ